MLAYHMLSPALSIEEAGLTTHLQSPPDAGPSVSQATIGLQDWKCAGRRLVQIGEDCVWLIVVQTSFARFAFAAWRNILANVPCK